MRIPLQNQPNCDLLWVLLSTLFMMPNIIYFELVSKNMCTIATLPMGNTSHEYFHTAPDEHNFEHNFNRLERLLRNLDDPEDIPKVCWSMCNT